MVHANELDMKAFSSRKYTPFPLSAEEKIERRII